MLRAVHEVSNVFTGAALPSPCLRLDVDITAGHLMASSAVCPKLHLLAVAPLGDHVSRVVAQRSEKQMFRPNTTRIIAAMEHASIFSEWPVCQRPRDTMCVEEDRPARLVFMAEEFPVSLIVELRSPEPARRSLLNLFPEPISDRSRVRHDGYFITDGTTIYPAGSVKQDAQNAKAAEKKAGE